MENTFKATIIDSFNNIKIYIDKNKNIPNISIIDMLHDCYYYINILNTNNLIKQLSKEEIQLIINILLFLTNENTKRIKNIVNNLRTELNKPKDNYDNMSKEELIALLRNK
jgi:hypothetical protein